MIHLTDAIMMNRKRTEVKDVAEYTPMMQQYLKTKEEVSESRRRAKLEPQKFLNFRVQSRVVEL